jgi:hypothetical protein
MRRALFALLFLALAALAFVARCWNVREVFVADRVFFVDADCYSRMTRARLVSEGQGPFIRHHEFENWPQGTTPHTTAPMDWVIVAGKGIIDASLAIFDPASTSVLRGQTLDVAGALVSPLLGALTCLWLAWWARGAGSFPASAWLAAPLFFAVSPMLVHGTLLGRPDHQSLVLMLLAVALGAELRLAGGPSRGWALAAGIAWALALWVSLYEPLVLLVVVLAVWLVVDRRRLTARDTRPGSIAFAALLVVCFAADGWRISWPDAVLRDAFAQWKHTIGELAPLDPRGPLLYQWLGAGIVLAPALLGVAGRKDRRAWALFAVLLATFVLTLWQVRWGYFLALVFALSLPWQLAMLRRWWIVWPVFVIALWPVAQDWDIKLFPEDHPELDIEKKRSLARLEAVRLREAAEIMRSTERLPFLAPWWLSPSISYWSGQPGVAGSSHQSLPGIVASARFFLAPGPADAERIAQQLGVRWLLTDDPERLVATSQALLGGPGGAADPYVVHLHDKGAPRERVTEADLRSASPEARQRLLELTDRAEADALGSAMFSCAWTNQFYKLFRVRPEPTAPSIP